MALARAICKRSKILLLDEVTSDLDAHSQTKVQCTIDELRKSCTVIVVAHRLKTVEEADTITVLERGEIVESGSPAQLLKKKGRYFAMRNKELEHSKME